MKYKIIVDKQSRTNPSNEKREYIVDIEELRCKGNVYDSLVITKDEDYVMRKLSLSEYGILSELSEPIKETIQNVNIELFEGDNYIYLIDMVGNKFYAEYLIKNDFNDTFVTINQMSSAINQTAQEIEFGVNQKLEGYSTTEEMNSAIEVTAQYINSEVSKKVGKDEIISKINQSAEEVSISANKINLNGAISANGNFSIDEKGNAIMNDAIFTGNQIKLKPKDNNYAEMEFVNGVKGTILNWMGISFVNKYGFLGRATQIPDPNINLPDDEIVLYLSEDGATLSTTLIQATGIKTPKLTQTSLATKKKNIEKLDVDAIELVKNADICLYNLKNEKEGTKRHIGLIIGEGYNCPDEVISEDGQGIEQYSYTSLLYKAFQQLLTRVEKLEQEVQREKN